MGGHGDRPHGGRQLYPRGDAELRKDAIEVGPDGPMRDVETLADLAVGKALRSESSDLSLLLGELEPHFVLAVLCLPRRSELLARPMGPRRGAQGVKGVAGDAERRAGLGDLALAPKRRSV